MATADPITACGLRESEVNAIMEANVTAWLVRRGLPASVPRTQWPHQPWPRPPLSMRTRQRIAAGVKAAWARKRAEAA
jgi:hypothetical protein